MIATSLVLPVSATMRKLHTILITELKKFLRLFYTNRQKLF